MTQSCHQIGHYFVGRYLEKSRIAVSTLLLLEETFFIPCDHLEVF